MPQNEWRAIRRERYCCVSRRMGILALRAHPTHPIAQIYGSPTHCRCDLGISHRLEAYATGQLRVAGLIVFAPRLGRPCRIRIVGDRWEENRRTFSIAESTTRRAMMSCGWMAFQKLPSSIVAHVFTFIFQFISHLTSFSKLLVTATQCSVNGRFEKPPLDDCLLHP
jgi:hypothetical protein